MLPTDLTVAAVVERDGRFLVIEERSSGRDVITQPGGHIEAGESPEAACVREVLEETGCDVTIDSLLGTYLWINPVTRQQFLRIVYTAEFLQQHTDRQLDDGIIAAHWLYKSEIEHRRHNFRTPAVMKCIDDFLSGQRLPQSILAGAMPIQKRVADVMATASLI